MPKHLIRRISQNEIVGDKYSLTKRPIFEHGENKTVESLLRARWNRTVTYAGRYPLTNKFLQKHKNSIRVFADVGAANLVGAPTTIDAKKALGKEAQVFAVDKILSQEDLGVKGVNQLKHNINKGPLPILCDAIRLANVSQYMTKEELENALNNIWKSLNPHGFLLSAGLFGTNKQNRHNEQVLIKVRKTKRYPHGFVLLEQRQ
jgi:hypothetical protein